MQLLAKIKYKYDSTETDMQIAFLSFTVVFGGIGLILFRSIILLVIVLFFLTIELLVLNQADGVARIFKADEKTYLHFKTQHKLDEIQEILSCKFRWNYHFLMIGAGGESGKGHVNYIFTRVEFTLANGAIFILGKELNQWNSIPKSLEYELFDLKDYFQTSIGVEC